MMTRTPSRLTLTIAAALTAAALTAALTATAQDTTRPGGMTPTTMPTTAPALVDSLNYHLWSKFKPGSSVTHSGDWDSTGGKVHVVMTETLKQVTADAVTLTVVSTFSAVGQAGGLMPDQTNQIPAKTAPEQFKRIGTEDVTAMGRTFACKVYQLPDAAGIGAGKIFVNDDVPGGVVKAEMSNPAGGQPDATTLTGMAAK